MKVIDLIIALQKEDPMMDVIVDATDNSVKNGFMRFVEIQEVEQIETEVGDKFVCLFPRMMDLGNGN